MADTPLADDYEAAGFGRRIGWGEHPAVLLVDPVQAYAVPDSRLYLDTAEPALHAMAHLVRAARRTQFPVIFTAVHYDNEPSSHAPHFARKVPSLDAFRAGNPLAAFTPLCAPQPGEIVIHKHYPSAFFQTRLRDVLTVLGVDTLVIGGFSTSGCVRATTLDALQYGLRPIVVRDAVADRDTGPHEGNLFDLDSKYADVVDVGVACRRLGDPVHPRPGRI
ncbi:isochorismatase family protein [Streptomyces sp. H27-S2]|uniref:isochorismatase family protein n=1 Tax=Streptomyces antarcticus TaxID=2996458 RepID=UPI002271F212|nr:isochorismatase family protein [Streptomyces sp. H27-S2]MCY0949131.1 isochorismatase family protein [Streptomyces sp. H27-S2]